MSKCVPELYRKCSVHDLLVHIEYVCSFHYLVLSELVQYLTLYLSK